MPLSTAQLTGLLRPLPPRYYSAASSLHEMGEEVHLLIAKWCGRAMAVAAALSPQPMPHSTAGAGSEAAGAKEQSVRSAHAQGLTLLQEGGAEGKRYLPDLITALEIDVARFGLEREDIVIRMTGCPNGCARPYLAEIDLVGTGPGRYKLYLGGAFGGTRTLRRPYNSHW